MESTQLTSVLNVKTARGNKLINLEEILYLEAKDKHSLIYLINSVCIETHHLLKWYEDKLPVPEFCRCHHSFIVNCFYVDCTCGYSVVLEKNNIRIPVSRDRKQYYLDNLRIFQQKQTLRLRQNDSIYSDIMQSALK
jgi:DNA-binding LytR/AlgR family response regulator